MNIIVYTLITSHIGVLVTSVYLHRGLCHKQFTIHPILEHTFRFLLWITEGIASKNFVSQHRKHHKYSDVQGDPHSPKLFGYWNVTSKCLVPNFFKEYKYYETEWALKHYGGGTPDDWLEKNVYCHTKLGPLLLLTFNIFLFGWWGIVAWVCSMFLTSLFVNAVITGFGHWFGYRNYEMVDNSRNVFPIGILSCGEVLHHNHHKSPRDPNFAHRWFEFDLGWIYIKVFEKVGLLTLIEPV
jgi:stearoyl-CoA desaturase (delta-9 desaturase)